MPYNLQSLAQRARPWRIITPPQSEADALFRLYAPMVAAWDSAAAALMSAYTLALATGSTEELAAQDQGHADEIAAALLLIQWHAYFQRLEQWQRKRWTASVANAAGVDVSPLLARPTGAISIANRAARRAEAATVRQAARQTVRVARGALVPNAALTGVDAILGNAVAANASLVRQVSDQTRARIANVVFNGVAANRPVDEVADEIAKGLTLSRKRARAIAKDQVHKATKALNKFRIEEAGFNTGTWQHLAGQLHPRVTHRARDKSVLPLSDSRWGELMWANCHCTMGPPPLLVKGRGNVASGSANA